MALTIPHKVAKLFPYRENLGSVPSGWLNKGTLLFRGKPGMTDSKVEKFRPMRIGSDVVLRGDYRDHKVAYGWPYRTSGKVMARGPAYVAFPSDACDKFAANQSPYKWPTSLTVSLSGYPDPFDVVNGTIVLTDPFWSGSGLGFASGGVLSCCTPFSPSCDCPRSPQLPWYRFLSKSAGIVCGTNGFYVGITGSSYIASPQVGHDPPTTFYDYAAGYICSHNATQIRCGYAYTIADLVGLSGQGQITMSPGQYCGPPGCDDPNSCCEACGVTSGAQYDVGGAVDAIGF